MGKLTGTRHGDAANELLAFYSDKVNELEDAGQCFMAAIALGFALETFDNAIDLDAIRMRLRKPTDTELISYGKDCAYAHPSIEVLRSAIGKLDRPKTETQNQTVTKTVHPTVLQFPAAVSA